MNKRIFSITLLVTLLLGFMLPSPAQAQSAGSPLVLLLTADGPVTPVMAGYIERGLERAVADNASLIIIQLNTPGGSVDVMNTIIQSIRNSPIPVVVYVSPRGAMAASAGTLLTLAGHLAAMAPETTIGAASPVGTQGEDIGATMEDKVKQILRATVRNLAAGRGEEAVALAEDMIENARAVTAIEALDAGLIDYIAVDLNDLLEQLNGAVVMVDNESITLQTATYTTEELANTFIERVLQLLIDPNIVFLLLAIGVQAILIELSSPGGWVAGFVGAVCLLLSIYGLGILPVNWFGLLFFALAFILFIVDIKAPTHGALTAAGVASFIAGSLILFNSTRLPGFPQVSIPLVVGTGIFLAISFSIIIGFAIRALKAPPSMGRETLPGQHGFANGTISRSGIVVVGGEQWSAEVEPGGLPIADGIEVEVVQVKGLRLVVRKVPNAGD